MPRIPLRPVALFITLVLTVIGLLRFSVPLALLALMVGVTVAVLVGRQQAGRFGRGKPRRHRPEWRPTVQHQELPPPANDPVIGYPEPALEQFGTRQPPLAHLKLDGALRTQLDGFALGRSKRIMEAPDLLSHAAADAESWPVIEDAVQRTLALARSRGVEFNPTGQAQLQRSLALSAAQGVLLAEWRQLDDGKTMWQGASAGVRASDAFAIQRISEAMERQQLPDLFAGVARRPPDLELRLLLPYALSTAFYLRLRGNPPNAFAA